MRSSLVLFIVVGAAGCAMPYSYSSRSTVATPPKPAACDFEITATVPASGYKEIGTLNGKPDAFHNQYTKSQDEFRNFIKADVCQAGGDLVVAEMNGFGDYVRGVVFQRTP